MSEASPKRGLGRGLNALFEDDEDFGGGFEESGSSDFEIPESRESQPEAEVESAPLAKGTATLGVEQMEPSQFQPRKMFDDETLNELAESIKVHGLLQPIVVRKSEDAGGADYEIIAGERRWRAAQKAQLHEVPVIIKELSDLQALEIALIENLQREDLNPVDEAMGLKRLLNDYSYTQDQLAKSLGKSRSYIANIVRLLNLPDIVLGYVETGDLSAGHARALITVPNAEELARKIVKDNMSVRETERMVAEHSPKSKSSDKSSSRESSSNASKDVNITALEKEIADLIGMRVSIEPDANGEGGKITVAYKSLEQFDVLLKKIYTPVEERNGE